MRVNVMFTNAYVPNLVLGQTEKASLLHRESDYLTDEKHDVLMEFNCRTNTWLVFSKRDRTSFK